MLDFALQPKITGFGPVPDELADDADANAKGVQLLLIYVSLSVGLPLCLYACTISLILSDLNFVSYSINCEFEG